MAKVIIHLGYHKTATTSLQDDVFEKQSGIKYLGKSTDWVGCDRSLHQDFIKAVCSDTKENFSKLLPLLQKRLGFFSMGEDLLISDELLLGDSKSYMGGGIALPERMDRILSIFESFDTEVMLTLREYKSALHSLYVQKYPYLKGQGFSDFYNDPSVLNLYFYSKVYYFLTKKFKKVHLISFELLKYDEAVFKQKVTDVIGVDISNLDINNKNQKRMSSGNKVSSVFSLRGFFRKLLGEQVFSFVRSKPFLFKTVLPIWKGVSKITLGNKMIPGISEVELAQLNELFYKDMLELKVITSGEINYSESFK